MQLECMRGDYLSIGRHNTVSIHLHSCAQKALFVF